MSGAVRCQNIKSLNGLKMQAAATCGLAPTH